MSRRPPPARRSDGLTGELFSTIPQPLPEIPASMDFRKPVAQLVSDMLKASPGDRWEVAARMSRLADVDTSKALLDSYTAHSREESNLPFWKAPLIEIACNRRDLAEWHARVLGGQILWGADVLDAESGRLERHIAELQDQLKQVRGARRRIR